MRKRRRHYQKTSIQGFSLEGFTSLLQFLTVRRHYFIYYFSAAAVHYKSTKKFYFGMLCWKLGSMHIVSIHVWRFMKVRNSNLKEKTYETFFWFNCTLAQSNGIVILLETNAGFVWVTIVTGWKNTIWLIKHHPSKPWKTTTIDSKRVSKSRKSFSWKRNRWCNGVSGFKYSTYLHRFGCSSSSRIWSWSQLKLFLCEAWSFAFA